MQFHKHPSPNDNHDKNVPLKQWRKYRNAENAVALGP